MDKFIPRQICIVYPAGTLIEKFILFGFSVYCSVLEDGSLDTIIEETEWSQKTFSDFLKYLWEEEIYNLADRDFEEHPELDSMALQNSEIFS